MVSAIFTEQLSDIGVELAQLQQLIESKRQQQQRLLEMEDTFAQVSQGITGILDAASELGEGAIAKLKGAILTLVNPNDNDNDTNGNGGQPTPKPNPNNGTSPKNAAPTEEPWTTEWACPLMSPLACYLEDAPTKTEKLNPSDKRELSQPETNTAPLYKLVMVGDRVGYFRCNTDDSIAAAYVGFGNKNLACLWSDWILKQKLAASIDIRLAKRLTAYKHELKISGISIAAIETLASFKLGDRPHAIKKAAPAPTPSSNRSDFKTGMPVITPDSVGKILSHSEDMKSFSQKDYFEIWLMDTEKKLGCYADELTPCNFLLKRDKSSLPLERYWVEAWDGSKLKPVGSICLTAAKLWSHSHQRGFTVQPYPTRETAAEALLQAIAREDAAWKATNPNALEPAF